MTIKNKTWTCLSCNSINKFRKPTTKEIERTKFALSKNPYAKYMPKGFQDCWCDTCKAHNTIVDGKPISSSGGSGLRFLWRAFVE